MTVNTNLSSLSPLELDIQTIIDNGKVIGRGSERICYALDDFPGKVFKISLPNHTKQAERELAYYEFLRSRSTSFEHIPLIYGFTKDPEKGGIIILQQLILDDENKVSKSIYGFLDEAETFDSVDKKTVYAHEILNQLEEYLIKYNIVTCDVVPGNILLCRKDPDNFNFYLIDGIGTHDFIPLCKYWPWLGEKKIRRHMKKARRKLNNYAKYVKNKIKNSSLNNNTSGSSVRT